MWDYLVLYQTRLQVEAGESKSIFLFSFSTEQFLEEPALLKMYCQTLGLVLRLRVDFVLPLSQEEQEEEEEEEEPLTNIYQKGLY